MAAVPFGTGRRAWSGTPKQREDFLAATEST